MRSSEINRPSEMKLLFIFFLSTSILTLFKMAIHIIPLIIVGMYQCLVYCIEISASNDDDRTILSHDGADGKLLKSIKFGFS